MDPESAVAGPKREADRDAIGGRDPGDRRLWLETWWVPSKELAEIDSQLTGVRAVVPAGKRWGSDRVMRDDGTER